ncbi:MAG TPA: tetratricopeptide repeat protein [Polyangia bacterium]
MTSSLAPARPLLTLMVALLVSLPAVAPAFPALREPPGPVPDEVRAALREALSEEVPLLGAQAIAPRPAADAKARLLEVAQRFPTAAEVQRRLAPIALAAGDAAAAEAALTRAVELSGGAAWAQHDLAAFYEARGDVLKQVQTLERLAAHLAAQTRRPGGADVRAELRRVYERILAALAVKRVQNPDRYRRALVDLSPDDSYPLHRYLDELVAQRDPAAVRRAVALYLPRRPRETVYLARVLAGELERARDVDGAVAVYTKLLARDPVPEDARRLYGDYLDLLDRTLRLRPRRRALELGLKERLPRGPDLATLVFMLMRDGKGVRARALLERVRVEDATATPLELRARARLAAAAEAPQLQITFLYAAARPGTAAKGALREEVLVELARALLGSATRSALTPRAPLASFDLAKLDSGPSILGGLASLLFIGTKGSGAELERAETALGNGQRALVILAELRRLAPRSRAAQELLARAVQFHRAYKLHRDAAALAEDFLRSYPQGREYFDVGLAGAEAYADDGDVPAAEKLYRRLLDTAQRRADDAAHRRVLDAWVGVLVERRRDLDAVKVYSAEVKRRPQDRALLERFLGFVEQRNLYDDELRLYREAARRFGGASFHARIARFYLAHRRVKDFRDLNEAMIKSLGDEELARYLQAAGAMDLGGREKDDRVAFARQRETMLRALYLKALARFPLDPGFARRVIESYGRSRDAADLRERDRLLTRYAVLDPTFADEFVRWRASRGRLDQDLAALKAGRTTAERILASRMLTFASRFDEGLPAARAVLADFPADRAEVKHAAELEASLARPTRAAAARAAARTLDAYLAVAPADEALTTRAGDLLAEAGLLDEARARYEQIVALRPADLKAYLRLATVYWDYYVFDRAAAVIERARRATRDPDLYAEKLAAVYESARDRDRAVREYVRISWSRLDRSLGWVARTGAAAPPDEGGGEGGGEEGGGADERGGADEAPPPAEAVRQRTPAAEQVLDRLAYLARQHRLRGRIDEAYAAAMRSQKGDPRPAVAYAGYLVTAGRRAEARDVWLKAVAAYADRALLERAVTEGPAFGVGGSAIVIAARRRLATLADGAPDQVYALAAALEAAGQVDAAAAELTALAARLRAGAALEPAEIAVTEERLADLFARARRPPEAIAARRRAAEALPRAPQGQAGAREAVELKLAAELAQAGQTVAALALYAQLAAQMPGDPRPIIARADLRWATGEREAALAELARAVRDAKQLPPHHRGPVVHGLRLALIARFGELGRAREVVDQYIEIINREPTLRDLVDTAVTYARTHGGLDDHLLDYYQRAATRSPKDHRFPVIVAWIFERRGQPAEAARAYARALEIAPGRKDLTRAQADDLSAAGRWAEAAAAYRALFELEDHDRALLLKVAEMQGRAGRLDEGRRAVQEMVRGSDRPGDYIDAAHALERMGLYADAHGYAESALGVLLAYPQERQFQTGWADDYARLAVRLGAAGAAYTRLSDAARRLREGGATPGNTRAWHLRGLSSVVEHGVAVGLPRAVADAGGAANAAGLRQALVAAIGAGRETRDAAARLADRANLPDLAREIYEGAANEPRLQQALWGLFTARGAAADALTVLERMTELTAADRAARRARAQRQLGDEAKELDALRAYFAAVVEHGRAHSLGPFASHDPLVGRYLELLARRRDRAELARVAQTRAPVTAQIADFFLARGERDLALAAIGAAGQGEPPVWLDVKRATALAALGETGAAVRDPLARVLRLTPIGDRRAHRPDLRREVVGARAFALTARLGEVVGRAGDQAQAARLLAAVAEARPRDPAAYVDLGDRLLALGAAPRAEEAYARALVLRPGSPDLLDKRAVAVLKQGNRPRALATWHEIIARPGATLEDHLFHARALDRAGLTAEARAALAPYLTGAAPKLTDAALLGALRPLRALYPSHAAGSEWDLLLGRLLLPTERLSLLAAAAGVEGGRQGGLVDPPARGPYLERGLALLARSTDAARRWSWRLARLGWLLDTGRLPEVGREVAAALPEARPAAPAVRVALRVAAARARVRAGDVAGALAELTRAARADDRALFAAGIAMLREEQRERPATELAVAMYQDLLAQQREDRGTLLGLADALLKLGRKEAALVYLGRLVVREPDDAESQRLAAELLENHKLPADARGPRLTLLSLRADDADNRVMLGRDEIAAGLREEGLRRLIALVDEAGAPRAARFKAGEALLEAAGGDAGAAARLADRLAGRPATEEPPAVAAARLRRVGRPADGRARDLLERVARAAPAPAQALAVLGDDALARGQPQEAARRFERAVYYGGTTPRLAHALFTARRAAGQHDAALLALTDADVRDFLDGVPGLLAPDVKLDERGARAAAALAHDGGDAAALATAALDSARRGGDEARVFYYALAAAAATRGPTRAGFLTQVEAARAALRDAEQRAESRRLTRTLDSEGGSARPPSPGQARRGSPPPRAPRASWRGPGPRGTR